MNHQHMLIEYPPSPNKALHPTPVAAVIMMPSLTPTSTHPTTFAPATGVGELGRSATDKAPNPMQTPVFTIRKTQDPEERLAIYRLRYTGLITDMGLACSDLARSEACLRDEADATGHLFAATIPEGTLVGTVRTNLLREAVPSPFDSLLHAIGNEAPHTDTLSVTSRLVVSSSHRHSTLAARLVLAVYQHAIEHDICHDAIFVQSAHVEMYVRMGYRPLSIASLPHPQGTLIPLLLTVRDWDYLTSIGSIFRRAPSFGQP